jgi:hypothetical protein
LKIRHKVYGTVAVVSPDCHIGGEWEKTEDKDRDKKQPVKK